MLISISTTITHGQLVTCGREAVVWLLIKRGGVGFNAMTNLFNVQCWQ